MTQPSVALVTVASESYRAFAYDLEESVYDMIRWPLTFVTLPGVEGFPIGTECRHGIFAEWLTQQEYDVAFLLDADMLAEEPFDTADILPSVPGIVATLHPGYVGMPRVMLPYEDRPESRAFVPDGMGEHYYCGGVIGGTRKAMLDLSRRIDRTILMERDDGREIRWHDESCLNRILAAVPPVRTLSPAFCHPDHDTYYREQVWGGVEHPRHIVALDKSPAERVGR